MVDQGLPLSLVQLALLVTNSQGNVKETGQQFCLDKSQKERFGVVDSFAITTETTDEVFYSAECRLRCGGRMKENQEKIPPEKEERGHAVAELWKTKVKGKLSPVVCVCTCEHAEGRGG